eukprot:865058-Pelagomonas_calceolata.AAC.8
MSIPLASSCATHEGRSVSTLSRALPQRNTRNTIKHWPAALCRPCHEREIAHAGLPVLMEYYIASAPSLSQTHLVMHVQHSCVMQTCHSVGPAHEGARAAGTEAA